MEDQELKPLCTTRTVTSRVRISSRIKMWFAKDSVTNRQPPPTTPESDNNMHDSLSDDDDVFVDKVATTLDHTREIPISRPSSPTPAATPDAEPSTKDSTAITVPVMLHKCKPMFRNGDSRCFGKVLEIGPDEIALKATTTWNEFYREVSSKLIHRFGDDVKISSLEDHACLSKITVEHGKDSTMTVTKEEWREVLDSIRVEVMFGRKIVLNLWFASFVEFEREERKWWKKMLRACGGGK